jgi:hypothetical protein
MLTLRASDQAHGCLEMACYMIAHGARDGVNGGQGKEQKGKMDKVVEMMNYSVNKRL